MDQQSRDDLLSYIDKMHSRTRRVAQCIPADLLEHSFGAGRFTLGDLVRHLAAINRYMFVEVAAGRASRYPGHGRELADGLEAVLAYHEKLHAESMEVLAALPLTHFDEKCTTPDGARVTVWKWLRLISEHEAHHRGQIYTLLGQLGVATPPIFGLTSEEVRAKSVRQSPFSK